MQAIVQRISPPPQEDLSPDPCPDSPSEPQRPYFLTAVSSILEKIAGPQSVEPDVPEEVATEDQTHQDFALPLDRIRVTTVNNFWKMVSASTNHGLLLSSRAATRDPWGQLVMENGFEHSTLAFDLQNTVILLPRIVTQVRGLILHFRLHL